MTRHGMEDSSFSALKYSIGLMTGVLSKDAPLGVELIDIIIIYGRTKSKKEGGWRNKGLIGVHMYVNDHLTA